MQNIPKRGREFLLLYIVPLCIFAMIYHVNIYRQNHLKNLIVGKWRSISYRSDVQYQFYQFFADGTFQAKEKSYQITGEWASFISSGYYKIADNKISLSTETKSFDSDGKIQESGSWIDGMPLIINGERMVFYPSTAQEERWKRVK